MTPNKLFMQIICRRFYGGRPARLAEDIGVSRQAVYNWLSPGKQDPETPYILRVLARLRIRVEDVWAPDPKAIYYRGIRIDPESPEFRQVDENIRAALRGARPDLARELDL